MKKILLSLTMLVCCTFTALSQTARPLVSVDWLNKNTGRDDLVLFHIGDKAGYEKEHIPGAQYISSKEYTTRSEDGSKMYDLPAVAHLKTLFESKGVDDGDTIILYAGSDWISPMTRLYFTLDYLGYADHTMILDGGMPLWKSKGGAVTTKIPNVQKGHFTPHPNPNLVVSTDYVLNHLNSTDINIVDARAAVFYQSIETSMGKKGHIPGAKTLPYTSMVSEGPNGSYLLLPDEKLQALFDQQGLDKNKPLIVYCHIGQQATLVYLAAKILGYKTMLYDGSFHDWAQNDYNPIETTN